MLGAAVERPPPGQRGGHLLRPRVEALDAVGHGGALTSSSAPNLSRQPSADELPPPRCALVLDEEHAHVLEEERGQARARPSFFQGARSGGVACPAVTVMMAQDEPRVGF